MSVHSEPRVLHYTDNNTASSVTVRHTWRSCAVFDADTFDDIFRDMVEVNEECTIAKDCKTLENFIFNEATVERLLATEAIAPSGAACLTLACQRRAILLT